MKTYNNKKTLHKAFVAGLARTTTDGALMRYFQKYGHVISARIIHDPITKLSRGSGILIFDDPESVDTIIKKMREHGPFLLDGRPVTMRRYICRDYRFPAAHWRTDRIRVTPMTQKLTQDSVRGYFAEHYSRYGDVKHIQLHDHNRGTRASRRAVVTFDNEDIVDRIILVDRYPNINGSMAVLKKTESTSGSRGVDMRRINGYGGYGWI